MKKRDVRTSRALSMTGYALIALGVILFILGLWGEGLDALASASFLSLINSIFIISLIALHLSERYKR